MRKLLRLMLGLILWSGEIMTLACEIRRRADRAVSLLLGMHHHPGQYCAYLAKASLVVTMRNIEPAQLLLHFG